ncbi:MAG TPA: GNAT family N-acetyltransferase [Chitinophagaceae bacterium]|nr:GNAT family N-acetyltransferase [Chitinophagaceae bacterium]
MKIQIRQATRSDCPRMLELIRELAEFERAPESVTVTREHFEESGFGEHPVWWAYVASISDEISGVRDYIAGFALYYIRYSTWKGQRMYLEDILVTEAYRGRGLGKLLFEKLIEVARDKKFDAIGWQVLDWNDRAISFYGKYGARYDEGWLNAWIPLD